MLVQNGFSGNSLDVIQIVDWSNSFEEFLNEFLYEGSQVKNVWIP